MPQYPQQQMNYQQRQYQQLQQAQKTIIPQPTSKPIQMSSQTQGPKIYVPDFMFADPIESQSSRNFVQTTDYAVAGSRKAVYQPVEEMTGTYYSICKMPQYMDTFPMELRARDYALNDNERPIPK